MTDENGQSELEWREVSSTLWLELRQTLKMCSDPVTLDQVATIVSVYANTSELPAVASIISCIPRDQQRDPAAEDLLSRVAAISIDRWLSESPVSTASALICILYLEHALSWNSPLFRSVGAWLVLSRWCNYDPSRSIFLYRWLIDRAEEQIGFVGYERFLAAIAIAAVDGVVREGGPHGCDVSDKYVASLFRRFGNKIAPE